MTSMVVKLERANILTAFEPRTVGSKVTDPTGFLLLLTYAVELFDFESQTTPGQGLVRLSSEAHQYVSAGVGRKMSDTASYVLHRWRGNVGAYLRREYAAPVESVSVVVYTTAAYLADPDVASDAREVARIKASGCTHVIVAVLASAGPEAPLSPGRLVANLAGGNKDALAWDADTIRAKARESVAYHNEWSVVAD